MTDALFKKGTEEECSLSLITFTVVNWIEEFKETYKKDEQLQGLITQVQNNQLPLEYSLRGELLLYKNRLYIPQ